MKRHILGMLDNRRPDSVATALRKRRLALLVEMVRGMKKPGIRILDVGGTVLFWENMEYADLFRGMNVAITVMNMFDQSSRHESITTIVGDARDLSRFKDKEFDVVFSNSVIEHLGTYADQLRMAREIGRVGNGYFVQTPNRHFPIEPHFLVPLFQFFPFALKVFLLSHCNVGWYERTKTRQEAVDIAREIRLLTSRELRTLFPDGKIVRERILGLTKSFIAYKA